MSLKQVINLEAVDKVDLPVRFPLRNKQGDLVDLSGLQYSRKILIARKSFQRPKAAFVAMQDEAYDILSSFVTLIEKSDLPELKLHTARLIDRWNSAVEITLASL